MSNPVPWHPAVLVRTSAGWFIDEDDRRRWWDGYRWTEHYAPVPVELIVATADSAVPAVA